MTDTPPVDAPDPRIHTDEFREKVAALRRPLTPPVDPVNARRPGFTIDPWPDDHRISDTPPVDAQPVEPLTAGEAAGILRGKIARAKYPLDAYDAGIEDVIDAARAGDGLLAETARQRLAREPFPTAAEMWATTPEFREAAEAVIRLVPISKVRPPAGWRRNRDDNARAAVDRLRAALHATAIEEPSHD